MPGSGSKPSRSGGAVAVLAVDEAAVAEGRVDQDVPAADVAPRVRVPAEARHSPPAKQASRGGHRRRFRSSHATTPGRKVEIQVSQPNTGNDNRSPGREANRRPSAHPERSRSRGRPSGTRAPPASIRGRASALRCGKRPNLRMMSRCLVAKSRALAGVLFAVLGRGDRAAGEQQDASS